MTLLRRSILAAVLAPLALLALLAASPARALTPYRVADLDPTFHSIGSQPERFVQVGSRTLFLAHTPGLGLWSSNGTAVGTIRLLRNQRSIEILTATGELVFFFACDAQRCRLQATDGTVAGTRALAGPYLAETPTAVAGPRRIFFVHTTPAAGTELWTSDGTPAGTRLVKDLAPGPASSSPARLVWFRDRLWFFALDGLWTSDGKASGTRRIATVGSGVQAGPAGTRLLFFAVAPTSSELRLWSSDGTAAGTRVLSAVALSPFTSLSPFASTATDAFFLVSRGDSEDSRDEVWASDGTPARTRKLAQFNFNEVRPEILAVGARVAFLAYDDEHGREIWTSDGRPAGTRVLDICPGSCSGASDPGVSDGHRIWFSADDDASGEEIWTSDLTPAGTHRVKDITPGFSSSYPDSFVVGGGKAYFVIRPFAQASLWVSDGTAAGTRQLVRPPDDDTSLALGLGAIVGGRLYFRLTDDAHGAEPWVSDGTVAGTALIADLDPSQDGGSFPFAFRAGAGRGFFFTNSDSDREATELWSSDGSAAGTSFVQRFENQLFSTFSPILSADLGSRIALVDAGFFGRAQIWISDGTTGGTFRAHSDEQQPTGRIRAIGGRLFFEAFDADHGLELWTTDGTPAGTVRLSDFENPEPFAPSSDAEHSPFRVLGGRIAFLVADAFGRFEPWVSDGTIGGTRHLADVYPALVAPFFELSSEIVPIGGKYFFVSGEESRVGTEPALWVTDLTAAGTRKIGPLEDSVGNPVNEIGLFALGGRVILFYYGGGERGFRTSDGTDFELGQHDVGISFSSTGPRTPTVWNDRLVFIGDDGRFYTTDGTAAGTSALVRSDGQSVAGVNGFAVLGGRLAYLAFDGIWDTDGTPAGTVRRVAPHEGLSQNDFLLAGDHIFFPGYDAATGTEPWALRP